MGRLLAERMPGVEVAVIGDPDAALPAGEHARSASGGLEGLHRLRLHKDGLYYSAAIVKTSGTTVVALAPISPEVLGDIVPGIGASRIRRATDRSPGPFRRPARAGSGWISQTTWVNPIPVARVGSSGEAATTRNFVVTTRPSAVLRHGFQQRPRCSRRSSRLSSWRLLVAAARWCN